MDLARLKDPFHPDAVHWRVGSTTGDKARGMALAYLDARDVMDRLDEVCGPAGWQSKFEAVNGRLVCSIGVLCYATGDATDWVWKSDGAGDTDHEPEKGGLSDAFKRAAVHWGIGRYLYRISSPWVAIEPMGKSYKIKDSERAKLYAMLNGGKSPANGHAELAPAPAAASKRKTPEQFAKAVLVADTAKLAALDNWLRKNGALEFGQERANGLSELVKQRHTALTTDPLSELDDIDGLPPGGPVA